MTDYERICAEMKATLAEMERVAGGPVMAGSIVFGEEFTEGEKRQRFNYEITVKRTIEDRGPKRFKHTFEKGQVVAVLHPTHTGVFVKMPPEVTLRDINEAMGRLTVTLEEER